MPSMSQMQVAIISSKFEDLDVHLNSKRFADFQIVCGDCTFYVHRVIVSHKCEFFKYLTGSDFVEAQSGVATFPEDEPALIARLLFFLYTGHYPCQSLRDLNIDQFNDVPDPLHSKGHLDFLHAHMYSLAIKYGVAGLDTLAAWAFRELDLEILKNPKWPDLAAYIYESTPNKARDLRNIILRDVLVAKREYGEDTIDYGTLADTARNVPDFGADLGTTMLSRKTFKCRECLQVQSVLVLRCEHPEKHKYAEVACMKRSIVTQECRVCHGLNMFDIADYASPRVR